MNGSSAQPPPALSHLAKVSHRLGWSSLLALAAEIGLGCLTLQTREAYSALLTVAALVAAFGLGLGAVVFSYVAAARLKKSHGDLTGLALAKTGHTTGSISATLTLLVVLMVPVRFLIEPIAYLKQANLNSCIGNLRQLDGAKESWALENRKTQTDTPTWNDLIGSDKYIMHPVTCPGNGSYTLGNMSQKPMCSITKHTLP
jgi:hypothetical protein